MNAILENLRQTGRTTRMVAEAKAKAAEGKAVIILVNNQAYARDIKQRFLRDAPDVKVTWLAQAERYGEIDWKNGPMNFWPDGDAELFADHFALESRYEGLLHQLHRWDSMPGEWGYNPIHRYGEASELQKQRDHLAKALRDVTRVLSGIEQGSDEQCKFISNACAIADDALAAAGVAL